MNINKNLKNNCIFQDCKHLVKIFKKTCIFFAVITYKAFIIHKGLLSKNTVRTINMIKNTNILFILTKIILLSQIFDDNSIQIFAYTFRSDSFRQFNSIAWSLIFNFSTVLFLIKCYSPTTIIWCDPERKGFKILKYY